MRAAIGIFVPDHAGEVLVSCFKIFLNVTSPFAAEARAACCALQALEMGFWRVVIEGDSLCIIKKLQERSPDFSPIRPIIEDARECNKAAHLLAATGMKDGGNRYWMEEEPCFLVQQIREDKRQVLVYQLF
ncbi:hypothetical protein PVK06_044726 [Gossypium arboreum]|uniref:RNase H type-1 domain-containing protein n=1 Tax=Gossypium arboreum TaxID=29729 RepID=A0ABR0MSJ0_GOSAR|nr:hypothetical protein PVK06_044726 [Gossypium arboreum]